MFAAETEDIMTNEVFAASQQWMGFWKKAAEDHMGRVAAMTDEWTKLEGKSIEQATSTMEQVSKLTKESIAYTTQLSSEWRKLTLEMLKNGATAG
jgi:hypothetical protein